MSIRPQHTCNILNDIKLWDIRKKFPKDYVGWVYIYCTKEQEIFYKIENGKRIYSAYKNRPKSIVKYRLSNGVVVARFWCDKVEEIYNDSDEYYECYYQTDTLSMKDLCKQSCLDYNELNNYLCEEQGKAIHITKLEIFDKPKEISEFRHSHCNNLKNIKVVKNYIHDDYVFQYFDNERCRNCNHYDSDCNDCLKSFKPLTRAPQSWCYVEVNS